MIIFLNNLKRIIKDKMNLFFMLVFPIIFIILSMMSVNYRTKINIGIVDSDNTKLTKILIDELEKKANIIDVKEDKIKDYLFKNKIEYAIIIPKGLTNKLINGEIAKINSIGLKETNVSFPLKLFINNFLNSSYNIGKKSKGDEESFYSIFDVYLNGRLKADYISLDKDEDKKINTLRSFGFLIMSMLILAQSASELILEDKKLKTLKRILSSPIKPLNYTVQNVLSAYTILLVQVTLIFIIMKTIFKADFGEHPFQVYILYIIFSAMCVALGTAINTLSKDSLQAGSMAPLIIVPITMLGGCFWPKDIMPEFLAKLSNFVPTSWIMTASEKLLYGGTLYDVSKNILVLLLFTITFALLGAWRKKDLLS